MLATTLQVRAIAKATTPLKARYTNKSKASNTLRHLCFKAASQQQAISAAKTLQSTLAAAGYSNAVKVTQARFYGVNNYVRVTATLAA